MDRRTVIALPARLLLASALVLLLVAPTAGAMTSHKGWPKITGMLLMNKQDQPRPLDGRPGADPFDGADPAYSCDGSHLRSICLATGVAFAPAGLVCDGRKLPVVGNWPEFLVRSVCETPRTSTVPPDVGHNELLGGHGSDVIHAGPAGDVLWGDFKETGQPTSQVDALSGGAGKDYIYASHGRNAIRTGGGDDVVHAHFGHGSITCDGGAPTIFLSRKSQKRYRLHGCKRISYFTLGY
jgi:Ca2+-binding RTX toxin-like protein